MTTKPTPEFLRHLREMPTAERFEAELGAPWHSFLPELMLWLAQLRDRSYREAGLPLGPRLRTLDRLDEVPELPLPPAVVAPPRVAPSAADSAR